MSRDAFQASGGEDGSRTRYLKVMSLVLYPMSYFTADESPMLLAEHTQQIPTSRNTSCADSFISRVSFVAPPDTGPAGKYQKQKTPEPLGLRGLVFQK